MRSSTFRVESSIEQPVTMARFKDRVISLRQAAVRIDKWNATELSEIRLLRQQRKDDTTTSTKKRKLSPAAKCREKFFRLENIKAEVMNVRHEKRHTLKRLVILQKIRTDEEESPSHILKKSRYFTSDGKDDDVDEDSDEDDSVDQSFIRGDSVDQSLIVDSTDQSLIADSVVDSVDQSFIDEVDDSQPDDIQQDSNQHDYQEQPHETLSMEEMRLAARAEVEEEIRMAKEVKRHLMETISKEREEVKRVERKREELLTPDETESNVNRVGAETPVASNTEKTMAGVQISTLCRLLDCVEEQIYDPDPLDTLPEPAIQDLEDHCADDTETLHDTVADLVETIEGCDDRLSDIEMMQSTILAENAALNGEDQFKTGGGSGLSRSTNHDGSLSPIFAKYYESSTEQKPQQAHSISRLGSFSRRVARKMNSFRLAAAKMDRQRLDHSRRAANQ